MRRKDVVPQLLGVREHDLADRTRQSLRQRLLHRGCVGHLLPVVRLQVHRQRVLLLEEPVAHVALQLQQVLLPMELPHMSTEGVSPRESRRTIFTRIRLGVGLLRLLLLLLRVLHDDVQLFVLLVGLGALEFHVALLATRGHHGRVHVPMSLQDMDLQGGVVAELGGATLALEDLGLDGCGVDLLVEHFFLLVASLSLQHFGAFVPALVGAESPGGVEDFSAQVAGVFLRLDSLLLGLDLLFVLVEHVLIKKWYVLKWNLAVPLKANVLSL